MTQNEIRIVIAILAAVMLFVGILHGLQHISFAQAQREPLPLPASAQVAPSLALSKANVTAILSLIAPTDPITVGQTFTVTARVGNLSAPLAAFQFDLGYDPASEIRQSNGGSNDLIWASIRLRRGRRSFLRASGENLAHS
jgi:hypothetical protein